MASIFFLNNILLLSVFETGFYFCFSSHFSVIFPVFPFFSIWVSVEMHTFAVSCVRVLSQYYQQKQTPEVFCKKDILRNFAKLTGKYLRQNLFFNKDAGLPAKFRSFATFLRTPLLQNAFRRLLLQQYQQYSVLNILSSFSVLVQLVLNYFRKTLHLRCLTGF